MSASGPAVLSSALVARKGAAVPTGYTPIGLRDLKTSGSVVENANENAGAGRPETTLVTQADSGPAKNGPPNNNPANNRSSPADSEPPLAEHARTRVSVRLDRERHLKLKLTAAHLERSLQDIITDALDRYLEQVAPEILRNDCACLGIKSPGITSTDMKHSSVQTGADQPSWSSD